MRFAKPFAASMIVVFLTVCAYGSDTRFAEATDLLKMSEPFLLTNTFTSVTISGRVKTTGGRPITAAQIILKDADTNEPIRSALSSSFGYYRIEQVETGKHYVLSVFHKRYLFALPAQLLEINEDRSGVDFTGEINNEN